MKEYKVKIDGVEISVFQDTDGKFIKPEGLNIGTNLKPSHEDICMARKPLAEKTVAENVLKWGTGGISIDAIRIGTEKRKYKGSGSQPNKLNNHAKGDTGIGYMDGNGKDKVFTAQGRFPANLIHDNSEEVRECFPETKSQSGGKGGKNPGMWSGKKQIDRGGHTDSGNASRFFKSIIYNPKASKKDRGEGNTHTTVKPVKLMEYLITMVTPDGGIVLDPFMGSGTTGVACKNLNRNFIGIEMDEVYFNIAKSRINGDVTTEEIIKDEIKEPENDGLFF